MRASGVLAELTNCCNTRATPEKGGHELEPHVKAEDGHDEDPSRQGRGRAQTEAHPHVKAEEGGHELRRLTSMQKRGHELRRLTSMQKAGTNMLSA